MPRWPWQKRERPLHYGGRVPGATWYYRGDTEPDPETLERIREAGRINLEVRDRAREE